jgi:radical SAM superfamily enzyme YgiQ (UPF0313 family)
MKQLIFEQGPIRPPSEAQSLLIRVTRNCSWNQCQFCSIYKHSKFERRTVEEVKADIDIIREIIDEAKALSWRNGLSGRITADIANYFLRQNNLHTSTASVIAWLYYGTNAVFLQDANNLILSADHLVQILEYLNRRVPGINRITTYARSQTAARKTVDDLKRMRAAGLDRVHVGLESGSDRVLELMKKGVTGEGHIKGGKNIIEAGMELSEYYMPGLGGKHLAEDHAIETARVLNAINPHFIRLRTFHMSDSLPLNEKVESGEFEIRSPEEVVGEIGLFIENLDGITSTIVSDHIGNMLGDVEGKLPEDKQNMLDAIDRFLQLNAEERVHYQVGRMMGLYHGVSDMMRPVLHRQVEDTLNRFKSEFKSDINDVLIKMHDKLMR